MARQKTRKAKTTAPAPAATAEPTAAEWAEVEACTERKKARRRAPRFTVEQPNGACARLAPAGVHLEVAMVRAMNALGITSDELAECLVSQIVNATHLQPSNAPVSETALNAALAAVTGMGPQDEAEAMLAAQMVGVHWTAMDLLRKVGGATDRTLANEAGALAVKLLRTYTAQLEALKRYRSAGEQRIVVQHQHVNVTADAAAVQVNGGANSASGGWRAASKPEERSHAPEAPRSVAYEPGVQMPCPDPAGDAVPVTGGPGESPVPDARRR
jgi:hypothetical protein